jgi:hydrogenase maturation protease
VAPGAGAVGAAYADARSAAAARHPIRVIVLGEPQRGDDGVAYVATRSVVGALDPTIRDRLEVRETGQLDPADLVELAATGAAVVVDAVVGVPPGKVVVVPLGRLATAASEEGGRRMDSDDPIPTPRSTHVLPVDQLVALAAALRGSVPRGVLVGLGGSCFELGAGFSPPVEAALPAFGAAIRAEIERLAADAA